LNTKQTENTKWPFDDAKSHISWVEQAQMIIADYPISFYTLKKSADTGPGGWIVGRNQRSGEQVMNHGGLQSDLQRFTSILEV
jgi:hypothetical protein